MITLAPGELSTYVPPPNLYTVGSTYNDPQGEQEFESMGTVKPLNVADLQCPTFGVGVGTSANGIIYTTVGPPWLPIIVPPPQFFTLNPKWQSICTGLLSYAPRMISFTIFHPPLTLSVESNLVAPSPVAPAEIPANPTTVMDPKSAPSSSAADPENVSIYPIQQGSYAIQHPRDPANAHDAPSPAATPVDPAAIATSGPVQQPQDAPNFVDPPRSAMDPANPGSGPGQPQPQPTPPPSGEQHMNDPKSENQGLGALILGALDRSGPQTVGNPNPVITIPLPTLSAEQVTLSGAQVISINPSGAVVDGISYNAGGPAIALSNVIFSLLPNQNSRNADPAEDASLLPKVLTVLGQTATLNASEMIIAGSTLMPGGDAITVSGVPISLSPSRILTVGSSSLSLIAQSVFTAGSEIFTASPTGFAIEGLNLSPGGSAQTIDGVVISLDQGGLLRIGSSTVNILTPQVTEVGSDGSSTNSLLFSNQLPATQTSGSNIFAVDGMIIKVDSSHIVVDGKTLEPGGPGTVIEGTSVSVESGGTLDVGSDRIPIPTGLSNETTSVVAFQGKQARSYQVPWLLLLGGITVSEAWLFVA